MYILLSVVMVDGCALQASRQIGSMPGCLRMLSLPKSSYEHPRPNILDEPVKELACTSGEVLFHVLPASTEVQQYSGLVAWSRRARYRSVESFLNFR